jgi:hypothetical protein
MDDCSNLVLYVVPRGGFQPVAPLCDVENEIRLDPATEGGFLVSCLLADNVVDVQMLAIFELLMRFLR